MPHDFVVQKNTPMHRTETKLKTNSGIYKVRNIEWVRQSLGEIVHDGQNHGDSEQMSWDRVLCSTQSVQLNTCTWKGHKIRFLDRREYATGHEDDKTTQALRSQHLTSMVRAWHNNWIKPFSAKLTRAHSLHLIFYDAARGICTFDAQSSFILDK